MMFVTSNNAALNSLECANVPLGNYSITHPNYIKSYPITSNTQYMLHSYVHMYACYQLKVSLYSVTKRQTNTRKNLLQTFDVR